MRESSEELTDLDDDDITDRWPDDVSTVATEACGLPDERDGEFFHAKVGAQVAQESAVQGKGIPPNDEHMQAQAQAQAQAQGRSQPLVAHSDDFTIKVSGRAVVKIPGAQIEYDGSEITISTNSTAGAGPGSGMPDSDKESTVYQAQAQDQDQARGPQQADDDSTLQGQIRARRGRRFVTERLLEEILEDENKMQERERR